MQAAMSSVRPMQSRFTFTQNDPFALLSAPSGGQSLLSWTSFNPQACNFAAAAHPRQLDAHDALRQPSGAAQQIGADQRQSSQLLLSASPPDLSSHLQPTRFYEGAGQLADSATAARPRASHYCGIKRDQAQEAL